MSYNGVFSKIRFQSTLPVWGGTAVRARDDGDRALISIHPPRVGRDAWGAVQVPEPVNFNPPSPCGEGLLPGPCVDCHAEISIHPPRVGRDFCTSWIASIIVAFQSTLPVWGGTRGKWIVVQLIQHFNPPSPCGEGPGERGLGLLYQVISIHPPRVGRDTCCWTH